MFLLAVFAEQLVYMSFNVDISVFVTSRRMK